MSENSPVGYPHHRCQKLCIEKIDSRKVTVLSSSTYEPDKNQGSIVLNFIKDADSLDSRVPTGFSESLQAKKKYSFLHGETDVGRPSTKENIMSKIESESKCKKKKRKLNMSRLCKTDSVYNTSDLEKPNAEVTVDAPRIDAKNESRKKKEKLISSRKSSNIGGTNRVSDQMTGSNTKSKRSSKEKDSKALAPTHSSEALNLLHAGEERKSNVRIEIEPRKKLGQKSQKAFPSMASKEMESQDFKKRATLISRESKQATFDKKLHSNLSDHNSRHKSLQQKPKNDKFPNKRRQISIIPDNKKKSSKPTKLRENFGLKQGVTMAKTKMSTESELVNTKPLSCTEGILSTPTKLLPQGTAISPDTETPEKSLSTPSSGDTVDERKKGTMNITKFLHPHEKSTVKTLKFSNTPDQDKALQKGMIKSFLKN